MLYIISTTFHLSVTVANDCFHKCEFYRIWKHRNLFIFILLCMKYFCQVLQASLHKQRIQNILKTIDGSGSLLWTLDSVQSVVSDSLQPHWQQHSRLPCPSPIPGAFQTHVHWLSDAIQPSHPLSFPSSPAFNLSQHQGLFSQLFTSTHKYAHTPTINIHVQIYLDFETHLYTVLHSQHTCTHAWTEKIYISLYT